jgi:hypothetical protein
VGGIKCGIFLKCSVLGIRGCDFASIFSFGIGEFCVASTDTGTAHCLVLTCGAVDLVTFARLLASCGRIKMLTAFQRELLYLSQFAYGIASCLIC